jgi:Pentapeptide repeats (8 copies)
MIKIQIKSRFGDLLFEYECEENTIRKTVEEAVKRSADLSSANLNSANLRSADLISADLSSANLSYANLSYADLRSADLSSANLRYADLSYADLSSANLSYADLRSADLSSADLRYATTNKRYIQVACIGSNKRMTTYCFEDDFIWCGCFKGSLQEFEDKVNETHKDNEQYLKEYIGFINYLKSLK